MLTDWKVDGLADCIQHGICNVLVLFPHGTVQELGLIHGKLGTQSAGGTGKSPRGVLYLRGGLLGIGNDVVVHSVQGVEFNNFCYGATWRVHSQHQSLCRLTR